MSFTFDSDKWIEEKKLELVNLMFQTEFGIADFRNTIKVINFDDLQTDAIRDRINKYRTAMSVLFKADEVRSVLDYYYLQQDKKPVLNLLKQLLKHYKYEFCRTSEYQGNYGGKKVYKSRYTIVPLKPALDQTTASSSAPISASASASVPAPTPTPAPALMPAPALIDLSVDPVLVEAETLPLDETIQTQMPLTVAQEQLLAIATDSLPLPPADIPVAAPPKKKILVKLLKSWKPSE